MKRIAAFFIACLFASLSSAALAQQNSGQSSDVVIWEGPRLNPIQRLWFRPLPGETNALLTPDMANPFWKPDMADVKKAEAQLKTIDFPYWACQPRPIEKFDRYYVGFTDPKSGKRQIMGEYDRIYTGTGKLYVMAMPGGGGVDGGCSGAQVSFDADTLKLIHGASGGN